MNNVKVKERDLKTNQRPKKERNGDEFYYTQERKKKQ